VTSTMSDSPFGPPDDSSPPAKRFAVALSFPGERRSIVQQVAEILSTRFGRERVLYDRYLEAEFARLDLDVYLPNLYRTETELIVVILCEEYTKKRWCGLELRNIRQLIKTPDQSKIMLLHFGSHGDYGELGILEGDGYVAIDQRSAEEIVELIYSRYDTEYPVRGPTHKRVRIWTVPTAANPHFTGREVLLADLERALRHRSDTSGRPQVVHGLGGLGKTQLAVEYAWRHRADYDAVLWVVADSPEAAATNLAALCRQEVLALPEAKEHEQPEQLDAVFRWLRSHERWLLVLDRVDSPEAADYVMRVLEPAWKGHVVVTSRRSDWTQYPTMRAVSVPLLEESEAVSFLLGRVSAGDFDAGPADEARAVAIELGRLPLALEQAAAYVLRHRVSFAEYRGLLCEAHAQVLTARSPGGTDYPASVAETWTITERRLSPAARAILRLAAFLAPDDIPRGLFTPESPTLTEALRKIAEELGVSPLQMTVTTLEDALVELADCSMITLVPGRFSCHPLVQAVQRDRMGSLVQRWLELSLWNLSEQMPDEVNEVRSWGRVGTLQNHLEVILPRALEIGILEPTGRLVNLLGLFLELKAAFPEAEKWKRVALDLAKIAYGTKHPNYGMALGNLGQLVFETNRIPEAEKLFREALSVMEAGLDSMHPWVAIQLTNLGLLLREKNQLAEAEQLLERALSVTKAAYGPQHPKVAPALNNLALVTKSGGCLTKAEEMYRRALEIITAAFGSADPAVSNVMGNLAMLLRELRRGAEAEQLVLRALEIDKAALGPDHPVVAKDLHYLTLLHLDTGRFEMARSLLERALDINERVYGDSHPKVAAILVSQASSLVESRHPAEAEPLLRRAYSIFLSSQGSSHPKVAMVSMNLSWVLMELHRCDEAEFFARKAAEILKATLSSDAPGEVKAYADLSAPMRATGKFEEAEAILECAVRVLHANQSQRETDQFREVLQMYFDVLKMRKRTDEEIASRLAEFVPR